MAVNRWTRRNLWGAYRKLAIWISGSEPESSPFISGGSGAASASDPNGSLYLRTGGIPEYRVSGAWKGLAVAGQTWDSGATGIKADVIAESTAATGVTVDGVVLKDSGVLALNLTSTPGASTAAAGSTTADAGVLPAGTSVVYPTTAADGTKGVRIHASDQVTGRMLFIGNGVSNQILKVYAPSGGSINGAAGDAAFSSASGKGVLIVCLSGAGNTWLAM